MRFYISDTHFFHEMLLGTNDFAPRPFPNVDAMNQAMIDAWNEVVKPTDTVYHLGDIAMHPKYDKARDLYLEVLLQLNGHIEFIKGNHDSRALLNFLAANNPVMDDGLPKFNFHDVGAIVKFNHHQAIMTHYPMLLGMPNTTSLNLHGHIHHSMIPLAENINVGVDAPERDLLEVKARWGAPLNEAQIDEIARKKADLLAAQHGGSVE
jgi:calcineurin-like phosphoesterase family protein